MPDPGRWTLVNVEQALDRWELVDHPDHDLTMAVIGWLFSRLEDPYQGVRREPSFPHFWYGAIPTTKRGNREVVCAYRIEEMSRQVICDNISLLRSPTD